MYCKTTYNITVEVQPEYLPEQSSPDTDYYVWAYSVTIANVGETTVTLKTRYWKIVDAHGRVQEVRGAGVVGEQPTLAPGERFSYTSGAPLNTSSGFMLGSYHMVDQSGNGFDVEIPAFSLDGPTGPNQMH